MSSNDRDATRYATRHAMQQDATQHTGGVDAKVKPHTKMWGKNEYEQVKRHTQQVHGILPGAAVHPVNPACHYRIVFETLNPY